MAFQKFVPVAKQLSDLEEKLDAIIAELDTFLRPRDLDRPFGELPTTDHTPPQEPSDDPS